MKTIYLVRHAKSSWDDEYAMDYERTLLKKGEGGARKVARHLAKKISTPDLLLSSHAVRAFETAKIFAEALHYNINDIIVETELYHANPSQILDNIFALDDYLNTIMLFGHNPGFTDLAVSLGFQDNWMKTSSVFSVQMNCDTWTEILEAEKSNYLYLYPKKIQV